MDVHDPLSELRIAVPCPMRWGELQGDGRKRFCSSCALHVHDTAALTRAEVRTLLESPGERVCLRIEFDGSGAACFREGRWTRARRLLLATAAGLLAVCNAFGRSAAAAGPPASRGEPVSLSPAAADRYVVMGSPAPRAPELRPDPKSKPKPKPKTKTKTKTKPRNNLPPGPMRREP